MKIGIISDVHANLVALEAVLAYLAKKKVDEIWFLGDAVGYGPWPVECVELIRETCTTVRLAGNHEWVTLGLHEKAIYGDAAQTMIDWTIQQLEHAGMIEYLATHKPNMDLLWSETRQSFGVASAPVPGEAHYNNPFADLAVWGATVVYHYAFTGKLKFRFESSPVQLVSQDPLLQLVHASMLDPVSQYLVPERSSQEDLRANLSALQSGVAFFGHTHVPTHLQLDESGEPILNFLKQGESVTFNPTDGKKRMLNPGSVGQPRDGDPRASVALLHIIGDPTSIESRWIFAIDRIKYDVDRVIARLEELGLPDVNGRRLLTGK